MAPKHDSLAKAHDLAHAVGDWLHDITGAIQDAWKKAMAGSDQKPHAETENDQPAVVIVTQYSTSTPAGYTGALTTVYTSSSDQLVVQTAALPFPTSALASNTTSSSLFAQATNDVLPPSIIPMSQVIESTLAVAPSSVQPTSYGPAVSATSVPDASAAADGSKGNGDRSAGVKVGIALGVIGAMLLATVALFWFFNMRRKKIEERKENEYFEKREARNPESLNPFADSILARPKPPQLSLRPLTKFLPDGLASSSPHPERRASRGAALSNEFLHIIQKPLPGTSMSGIAERDLKGEGEEEGKGKGEGEREGEGEGDGEGVGAGESKGEGEDSNNPFRNEEAEPLHEKPARTASPNSQSNRSLSPVSAASAVTAVSWLGNDMGAATAAAAAAVDTTGLARKASIHNRETPAPLDLTKPAPFALVAEATSPAPSEYSMHSASPDQSVIQTRGAAAIAAAGGPPSTVVHRVQLDFKPTMEDEMSLRAGQLVRLLHEYDDGWALCIRLDRSEQGVVPRTCLSTRPVKPRPPPGMGPGPGPGPGSGPHGRPININHKANSHPTTPGSSRQQYGHPQSPMLGPSPAGYRPPASPGGRMGPGPGQRLQSPASQPGPGLSQSPGGAARKPMQHSPARPSAMKQEYRLSEQNQGASPQRPGQAC